LRYIEFPAHKSGRTKTARAASENMPFALLV
jgi:hypothetical protein